MFGSNNNQQPVTNGAVPTDPKAFANQYFENTTTMFILVGILLFIFVIMYLQVSCVQMLGSDASGIAGCCAGSFGSNNNTDDTGVNYNTYCAGFVGFIALIGIVGISVYLTKKITTKNNAVKLVAGGHIMAALALDHKKEVVPTPELLQTQLTLDEKAMMAKGIPMHHLDVETDDSDSSDSEDEE